MLLVLLSLAAFLRLFRIESLMRFIWDEGRDMIAIREIIVHRNLTLFGPFNEAAGKMDFFGVFHYYLMLPALWIAHFNPVGPAIFTALLGVAAVGLTYVWCKQWLSKSQALIITGFMALSPLVVQFNRWPWNPNTTGFFGILFLLSLQRWNKRPTYFMAAVGGILLGLLFQLHYFTISLGAAALVTWYWQNVLFLKQKVTHAVIFTLAVILPNLTFVLFDLTHEGFYRNILFKSFNYSSSSQQLFEVNPVQMLLGFPTYILDVSTKFMGNQLLGYFLTLIFTVWLLRSLHAFWQTKTVTESFQLSIAWIIFLIITAFFPSLRDEYHSACLWIAFPVALVELVSPWAQKQSKSALAVVVVVSGLFLIYANHLFRPPSNYENMPRVRAASLAAAQDAQNKSEVNVASFVDANTRATRFRYFLINENIKLLDVDSYPQTKVLYVISPNNWEETRKNPAWELDTFRSLPAEQLWHDGSWWVYRVEKPTM